MKFWELFVTLGELIMDPDDEIDARFVSLLLAIFFAVSDAADVAGVRLGAKRRPKEGEKVFLRPLTASVSESCIC